MKFKSFDKQIWLSFLTILLVISLISLIDARECFQEQTNGTTLNDSTWCNTTLNYLGNYTNSGAGFTGLDQYYDTNYSTYAFSNTGSIFSAYYLPNLSISNIFGYTLNNITLHVKDDNNTRNLTLPISCYNYSNRILIESYSSQGSDQVKYLCYNSSNHGTELSQIYTLNAFIYEEGIYWDITPDFLENSQTFNNITYSNELEVFELNMTVDTSDWSSITAKLNYNNTNYTGNSYTINDDTIVNTTITIPEISNATTKEFYWIISVTNATGTFIFNSTFQNQTINTFNIYECNATFDDTFINFTVKDSETLETINASFDITFTVGDTNKSFSNSSQLLNSFAYCFDPPDKNYNTSAIIEYSKVNYAQNYYYLNYANLTNQTQNISIYLLNDSKATLTELSVFDDAQRGIFNVYFTIQRYDIGSDTFYTVGMARSSDEGKDLAYLNWYDTFYRFILTKDNQVIQTSSIKKISETPINFQILDVTAFEYDKFEDIVYTLTFNNVTNNFILTYILPSGEITNACLRVIKRSMNNDSTICDTCETSSSATIYCNVNGYGNGTFIGTFYAKGSLALIESIDALIGNINEIYDLIGNTDGSIYAFLFAGIVTFLLFVSPVMGIIGVICGMLGAMIMGFQPLNYFEFIGVVIIGGVIIWILKR